LRSRSIDSIDSCIAPLEIDLLPGSAGTIHRIIVRIIVVLIVEIAQVTETILSANGGTGSAENVFTIRLQSSDRSLT